MASLRNLFTTAEISQELKYVCCSRIIIIIYLIEFNFEMVGQTGVNEEKFIE